MSEPKRLSHDRVYDGKVFDVDRDRVLMPNGREVTVDIVRHPQSVVLIPLPERGRITLIRQYRYAVNRLLWELPAGSVDRGETPEQAARRECHEEIGEVPDTIVRMAAMLPTPGYCDEEMIFFKLSGLSAPDEEAKADEDEDIEVQVFDVKDVRDMIRRGEITDMKTVVGLTLI